MTFRILVLSATFLILAACGQKTADEPAASPAETGTDPAIASETAAEPAAIPRTASADGASVFFIMPADGATVSNPISIEFGIAGMDVVKAGDKIPICRTLDCLFRLMSTTYTSGMAAPAPKLRCRPENTPCRCCSAITCIFRIIHHWYPNRSRYQLNK